MSPAFKTLLKGELRYHLRDPVTLLVMLVLPLVLYPLVFWGFGKLEARQTLTIHEQVLKVAAPAELRDWLEESDLLEVVEGTLPEEIPRGAAESTSILAEVSLSEIPPRVSYRGDSALSRETMKRVVEVLNRRHLAEQREIFAARHVPVDPTEVLKVVTRDVASPERQTGDRLGRIIPLLLVMIVMSGGIYTALDLFSGEKERGTLETLLTVPNPRREIVASKFMVVLAFSLATTFMSLGSLGTASRLGLIQQVGSNTGATEITLSALVWLVLFSIPLAVTLTSLLVVVAAWAPDFRSGQSLALPVLLGVSALAGVSALPDQDLTPLLALVPITNLALAGRSVLSGTVHLPTLMLALTATVVWAGLSLKLAGNLLGRESVLLGGQGGMSRRARGNFWGEAIFLYAGVFSLNWFLGQLLQAENLTLGLLVSQLGLMALPAFAACAWLGIPAAPLMGLKKPGLRNMGLALVAGLTVPGLGMLAMILQDPFVPSPTSFSEMMQKSLTDDFDLSEQILLFAVLPGLCEEILFRGALLGLLEKSLGKVGRSVVVAAMFGLLHLSAPRLLPTAVLGLAMAGARLQSGSLWVPILIHMLNNSVFFVGVALGLPSEELPPLWLALGVGSISLTSIWLMRPAVRA